MLGLGGCAGTPPSPEALNGAEQAIAAAEAVGAAELSPVELRFANERLDLARLAIEKQKYPEALMAIEQSEINAELALENSRTALVRREANDQRRANDQLQAELIATYGEDFQ